MTDRPSASEITEDELTDLYQELDAIQTDAAKLRRVYEWSVARWEVERRRLTADIEWMRASAPPSALVSQLVEATKGMADADAAQLDDGSAAGPITSQHWASGSSEPKKLLGRRCRE